MRNRRRGVAPRHRSGPDRGPAATRVSRLRFGRRRRAGCARQAAAEAAACRGTRRGTCGPNRRTGARQRHRNRPHTLGYTRCTEREKRASARFRRPRRGSQRHHRESRADPRPPDGRRLCFRVGNRQRGHRAPRCPSAQEQSGSALGGMQGGGRAGGCVRHRSGFARRPSRRRAGAQGRAAAARAGRGRELCRLRRLGADPGHLARDLSRRRRLCRDLPGRGARGRRAAASASSVRRTYPR